VTTQIAEETAMELAGAVVNGALLAGTDESDTTGALLAGAEEAGIEEVATLETKDVVMKTLVYEVPSDT